MISLLAIVGLFNNQSPSQVLHRGSLVSLFWVWYSLLYPLLCRTAANLNSLKEVVDFVLFGFLFVACVVEVLHVYGQSIGGEVVNTK